MGRGEEGRGWQDKRDRRLRGRQSSLHIPLTRVASSSRRVVKLAQDIELYGVFITPRIRKPSIYAHRPVP